jgi:hypothetical protein
MIEKKYKYIQVILLFCVFLSTKASSVVQNHKQIDSDSNKSVTDFTNILKKPFIFWYERKWGEGDLQPLQLFAKSGIFSHVLLTGMHNYDVPSYEILPRFKHALEICRANNVEIIWERLLFPGKKLRDFNELTVFDPNYYIEQIKNIKEEARRSGIKLVALDAEPYGNSPLWKYRETPFSNSDYEKIVKAIDKAIQVEGQVDFILPSASSKKNHLYNATVKLGKYIIAEYTYYDLPKSVKQDPRRPYDFFGAYVSVTKENRTKPNLTLYTPKEILERQDLWATKKGLFIYVRVKDAMEVAQEFCNIKNESFKQNYQE